MNPVIVWLRRDLRLADNPALEHACATGAPVIPLFILDEAAHPVGAASRVWLRRSLAALDASLRVRGSGLLLRRGASLDVLRTVIADSGATHVFCNRVVAPAARACDAAVAAALAADGIGFHCSDGATLFVPGSLLNGQGLPYRVFTPFWRTAAPRLSTLPAAAAAPARIDGPRLQSEALDALLPPPRPAWDAGFWSQWTPGEAGARATLARLDAQRLANYPRDRDRPDRDGTSRLSPHLHFGELSPRQVLEHVRDSGADGSDFVRQLGWREFAIHVLHHFPASEQNDLDGRFAGFDWNPPDPKWLQAWQQGRTGVPIVDAGMRQLWRHGWMHNRVRMVVASFLTKHLRMHWLHGARWFMDTLVDADAANNTMGWQWAAGTGVDAAPYFRVFNPVSQGERFDPDGSYVHAFVPELARVPPPLVHAPWRDPALAARLAPDYPAMPIVDLAAGRADALAAYAALRGR
jgi:deoxyribodipyrimidine photo-lyase